VLLRKMFSCVLTLDHAKSKSEDVTKDASNLQGFCARMSFISQFCFLRLRADRLLNQ